jgi:glycosyltransferase involved in cell wall biosynthesis
LKVSIITVVYNNYKTIADTIESVLQQTYDDIEYIVVDGASSDGTVEIVQQHLSQISKFVSEADGGLYEAMNKGISLATGDVIGFLHADDFFSSSNVVSQIVSAFQECETDSIYADLVYVDRLNVSKIVRNWKSGQFNKRKFLYGWMPPHPTFYVKREIYERLGVYNTTFKSAADYELMLRYLYKHNISTTYIPKCFIKMRRGGKSNLSIGNRLKANREDHQAWLENKIQAKIYTRFLKPLRKLVQFLVL